MWSRCRRMIMFERVGVDGDVPRPSCSALTRRLRRAAYPHGRRHRVGRGSCPRPRACRGPCRAPVGGDPWRRPSDCDDRCCQRRASPSCRGHRDAYRPSDRRGTCRGRGNRREPCRPRRPVCPGDPPGKGFQFRLTSPPLSHPRRVDISRTLRHCSPAQLYRIAATMTTIWRPHWLIKHIEPVEEEVPDDDVPDVKVEPVADDDGINGEDEKTHLEGKGAKRKRGPPTKGPCEHGVKYCSNCKVCSACPHGRRRSQCKECGGASICEHGRVRSVCKECGGSGICEHGRRRSSCKECGGSSICEHGRERSKCKECGGASICEHGRNRPYCKECGGGAICEHGRRRSRCKECEK